jgi:hypothetical protein
MAFIYGISRAIESRDVSSAGSLEIASQRTKKMVSEPVFA